MTSTQLISVRAADQCGMYDHVTNTASSDNPARASIVRIVLRRGPLKTPTYISAAGLLRLFLSKQACGV